MDTKKLRQKVLDLAIRGKLVPQNPNDEPASVLLKRIYAEKQKLISEGKIKREKRSSFIFKGEDNSYYEKVVENGKETIVNIDDEIPFDIPESWAWCRLGNVINLISGQDLMPSEYNDAMNGIPYLTGASNIINGQININRWTTSPKSIAQVGSILLTCKGTVGLTSILEGIEKVHIARQFMALNSIGIFNKFLKLIIDSYSCSLKKDATSMIPGVSREQILSLILALPPLEEQKRIVEAIENLTNKISSIDEEYSSIEEKISLAKSKLLDLAIRGKLLPQDENDEPASKLLERIRKEKESAQLTSKSKRKTAESYIFKGEDNLYYEKIGNETTCIHEEIPFDIPENWVWCRLGDLCLLAFSGKSPTYVKQDNKHYVLGQRNNQMYGIDLNGVKYCSDDFWNNYPPEFYLKRNDILLNTLGTGTVGRVGIFNIDSNERYITDGHLFVFRNMFAETTYFIYYTLLCFRNFIEKEADGTTNQKFLKLNSVLRYLIPLPPLAEQKRIVDFITRANEQLDSMLNKCI